MVPSPPQHAAFQMEKGLPRAAHSPLLEGLRNGSREELWAAGSGLREALAEEAVAGNRSQTAVLRLGGQSETNGVLMIEKQSLDKTLHALLLSYSMGMTEGLGFASGSSIF